MTEGYDFPTRCPMCGDEFWNKEEKTSTEQVKEHLPECRPDLYPHEIGPNCTWPGEQCYWDHENGKVLDHMRSIRDD